MGGYEAGGKRKHFIDRESACAKAQIQPHFVRLRSCYLYLCNVFPPSLSSTSFALGPAVWKAPTWEGRTPHLGSKKLPSLVEAVFMYYDTRRMLGGPGGERPWMGGIESRKRRPYFLGLYGTRDEIRFFILTFMPSQVSINGVKESTSA